MSDPGGYTAKPAPPAPGLPDMTDTSDVPGYAVEIEAAAFRPADRFERRQLARWVQRVGSGVIDQAVIAAPSWVPYATMAEGDARTDALQAGSAGTLVLAILVGLWEGRTGRSPGKALFGLQLVDRRDGGLLGPARGIGRRWLHLLDLLSCYLGFLWPLWDEQRQTFADKAVNAVVLTGQRRRAPTAS